MFTQMAREKSVAYWEGSFVHPFIQELQAGILADEVFRYYLLQDRYYLEHFSKLYDLIAEASQDREVRELMTQNARFLAGGEIAIRATFFEALGITAEEIAATPVAPTAYHYVSHMYRQLIESSPNVACASMLPCSWLYQEIGTRLIAKGSPNLLYQQWIATYAGEDSLAHVQKERDIIDRLYQESSPQEQNQMLEAFYISAQMEYAFWEMAYRLEKWPKGVRKFAAN